MNSALLCDILKTKNGAVYTSYYQQGTEVSAVQQPACFCGEIKEEN